MNVEEIYTAFGDLKASLEQWSDISDVPANVIYDRYHHGWTFEEAICFDKEERRPSDASEKAAILKYMEKRIRVIYKAHMSEARKKIEAEAKRKEEERRLKVLELLEARKSRAAGKKSVKIAPSAKYKVVYFDAVSSHSGRWVTEIMSGTKLYELMLTHRHTIEGWEIYRGR